IERVEIIRSLRKGEFDVLVGINLLREGLDLPEVSLVAILDADKEGYLRSTRSLIQTIGRAARNINGKVLMYADLTTQSMRMAIDETNRRRAKQLAYNEANGITPKTIVKNIDASLVEMYSPEWAVVPEVGTPAKAHHDDELLPALELSDRISDLRRQMMESSDKLEYERAAELRDRIKRLERRIFGFESAQPAPAVPPGSPGSPQSKENGKRERARTNGKAATPGATAHTSGPRRPRGTNGPKRPRRQSQTPASSPKQGRLKLIPDADD
ncbi:MAG: UvrB/UvrC motif-containing protein, partial [Deltaproteobacteria bacterium]|nr:UvrB/UvrC motif-containing protein [Deltaproteobacteria bacterium]